MNGFTKGMIAGMVVGAGASLALHPFDEKTKKKLMRQTDKMFTTIGAIADEVVSIMR